MKEGYQSIIPNQDGASKIIEQAKYEDKLFSDGNREEELNAMNEFSPKVALFSGEQQEDAIDILHKKKSISNETVQEIYENVKLRKWEKAKDILTLDEKNKDIYIEYLRQEEVCKKALDKVIESEKILSEAEVKSALLEKQYSLEKKGEYNYWKDFIKNNTLLFTLKIK